MSPSTSLIRYGQYQRIVMIVSLITGCVIWGVASISDEYLADPATYGPVITGPKAEWWAVPLALGAAVHLIAQVVNGDPRLPRWVTPLWRMISSVVVFSVFAAFAFGGMAFAPVKLFIIVQLVQSVLWAALSAWFVYLGASDLRMALRKSDGRI